MIELDDITVSIPHGRPSAETILRNITLSMGDGEWVAVTGPNGSGKSTLLRVLAGLCPVTSGRLRAGSRVGHGFTRRPPDRVRGQTTALLLQEPDNQFVASSVRNELLLSIEPSAGTGGRDGRLGEAIGRFSLEPLLERNPHRISGGEKQRLALATVWLANPEVLLLDEPTAYLDAYERERCVAFVRELNQNGASVVWATPGGDDLSEADRVVYLNRGEVLFDGPAEGFVEVARTKGFDVLIPGQDVRPPGKASARGRRAPPDPGRETTGELYPGGPTAGGADGAAANHDADSRETVISMRALRFAYDDVEVFRGVSGDVRASETVGIAGANGSGKSTLLSLMGGVLEPKGGTIHRRYTHAVEKKRGRREQMVFYLFQNPEQLFFAETVFEEVAFGLKSLGADRMETEDRVADALSRVGLDPRVFLGRSPFSLSLGEMRRLAFAMAFALKPRLLLLDEPTSCLDTAGRKTLGGLIEALRSAGSAVVMASHDIAMLDGMTDRCLAIENGWLV